MGKLLQNSFWAEIFIPSLPSIPEMLLSIFSALSNTGLAHLIQEAVRVIIPSLLPSFCLGQAAA